MKPPENLLVINVVLKVLCNMYALCVELGEPSTDVYGAFEPEKKMFIDQGWLIDETEIQLRFYKDPIHMYRVGVDSSPHVVTDSCVFMGYCV